MIQSDSSQRYRSNLFKSPIKFLEDVNSISRITSVSRSPFSLESHSSTPIAPNPSDLARRLSNPFHLGSTNNKNNPQAATQDPVQTWDALYKQDGDPAVFLTEWTPEATDYLIQTYRADEAIRLDQNLVIGCLKELMVGNNSQLFQYNAKTQIFTCLCKEKIRFLACTQRTTQGIVDFCLTMGTRIQRLHYTIGVIAQHKPGPEKAVLDAFGKCIDRIVHAIEVFAEHHFVRIEDPLELARVFDKPEKLVTMLTTILGCADTSRVYELADGALPSPVKLLNILFDRVRVFQSSNVGLFYLTRVVFERTSAPWVSELERLITVSPSDLYMRRPAEIFGSYLFLQYSDRRKLVTIDWTLVPQYFGSKFACMVCETVNCLLVGHRYRRRTSAEVALKHPYTTPLQWYWDQLPSSSKHRLSPQPASRPKRPKPFGGNVASRFELCKHDLGSDIVDQVESRTNDILYSSIPLTQREPPMDVVPRLSFDRAITTQWEQANALVLDMLVDEQSLLDHLHLIGNIYFLQCGELASRLESTIFDPSPSGLNLDGHIYRDRPWIPTLGQVNLLLSPIIEGVSDNLANVNRSVAQSGVLNFGHMQPKHDERLAGSYLKATNVLVLRYHVPQPLNMILTESITNNLGRIWAHLLAVMRLVHELKKRRYNTNKPYVISNPKIRSFIFAYAGHVQRAVKMQWDDLCRDTADQVHSQEDSKQAIGIQEQSRKIYATTKTIMDEIMMESVKIQLIGQALLDHNELECEDMIHMYLDPSTNLSPAGEKFVEREFGRKK